MELSMKIHCLLNKKYSLSKTNWSLDKNTQRGRMVFPASRNGLSSPTIHSTTSGTRRNMEHIGIILMIWPPFKMDFMELYELGTASSI